MSHWLRGLYYIGVVIMVGAAIMIMPDSATELHQPALDELDAELDHFLAQERPWERRVEVHDVAPGPVGDALEHVGPGAVGPGEADEGPTHVVLAALPQAQSSQVLVEPAQCGVGVAVPALPARNDQVVGRWRAPHHLGPAPELPLGQDLGEHRVHGHLPRELGLHALLLALVDVVGRRDQELAQRLRRRVVVSPLGGCCLAKTGAGQHLQGVQHAAVPGCERAAHDRLDFPTFENRRGPPLGVLVDVLGQVTTPEHAGVLGDQLLGDGVGEQRVEQAVDLADGAWRQVLRTRADALPQVQDEGSHVAGSDVREQHLAQGWDGMVAQPAIIH